MAEDVLETTSGLIELKTKIEEPKKHPTIKVIDVLIPCANTTCGLIGIASKMHPEKESELSKIKDGIKLANGQIEKQRKGPFGELELINEF